MVEYFSKNYPLLFKLIKRESINFHHVNQNKTCKSNSITFEIKKKLIINLIYFELKFIIEQSYLCLKLIEENLVGFMFYIAVGFSCCLVSGGVCRLSYHKLNSINIVCFNFNIKIN